MGSRADKGSGIQSDHQDLSRLARQAETIERNAERWAKRNGHSNMAVLSLSLYPPSRQRNGMWLLVAKGYNDGERLVAFQRGTSILTVLATFLSALVVNRVVWKPDDYADKPTLKSR